MCVDKLGGVYVVGCGMWDVGGWMLEVGGWRWEMGDGRCGWDGRGGMGGGFDSQRVKWDVIFSFHFLLCLLRIFFFFVFFSLLLMPHISFFHLVILSSCHFVLFPYFHIFKTLHASYIMHHASRITYEHCAFLQCDVS
jgi:hypothetical protein